MIWGKGSEHCKDEKHQKKVANCSTVTITTYYSNYDLYKTEKHGWIRILVPSNSNIIFQSLTCKGGLGQRSEKKSCHTNNILFVSYFWQHCVNKYQKLNFWSHLSVYGILFSQTTDTGKIFINIIQDPLSEQIYALDLKDSPLFLNLL